jgi:hypothetical protein
MSKSSRRIDHRTLSLFGAPAFDPQPIKNALSIAIRRCPKSREQICDLMSGYLGRKIAVTELDSWTAVSKPTHLPRYDEYEAFLWATSNPTPLDVPARVCGAKAILIEEADLLELARLQLDAEQIESRLALVKERARARMKGRADG